MLMLAAEKHAATFIAPVRIEDASPWLVKADIERYRSELGSVYSSPSYQAFISQAAPSILHGLLHQISCL
jgi:hypothetical protein